SLPSTIATTEFVVPKSIPTILLMMPPEFPNAHGANALPKGAERGTFQPIALQYVRRTRPQEVCKMSV
ncbi:MAG: hypothetical protein ACK44W_13105, partial [Planctomycetota bacterium]